MNCRSHADRWDGDAEYRRDCVTKGWTKWCKADLRDPCTSPGSAVRILETPPRWAKLQRMTELWFSFPRDAGVEATDELKDRIIRELSEEAPGGPAPSEVGA
ncbi:MAG: hypothetical protein GY772_05245 [bacterium]|nr:hypothetical protein [bacterium]